jgi:hypothetical protein
VSKKSKPLFIIPTAYPLTPQITLSEDRWQHIVERHPEVDQQSVLDVTANLGIVFPTTTAPNIVMFVNPQITTPGGTPLGVIVQQDEAEIITAFYNRAIGQIPLSQALWLLPPKK